MSAALASFLVSVPTLVEAVEQPCSLFVAVDGHTFGCEGYQSDRKYGPLLRAVVAQAMKRREGWKKYKVKAVLPTWGGGDALTEHRHDLTARQLKDDMDQTFSVDSVTVLLVADLGPYTPNALRPPGIRVNSEYHVARRIHRGRVRPEILWARYEEQWVESASGWATDRVANYTMGVMPHQAAGGGLMFASLDYRDPREAKGPGRRFRPTLASQVLSDRDVPSDLTAGDRIGPFAHCEEDNRRFVYYESEPQVLRMVGRPSLAANRDDAEVVLQVLVCKSGEVGEIKVQRGLPPYASMAVAAVSQWSYSPALSNEKPVSVWIEVALDMP